MAQELVSLMIDDELTHDVRQYCYKNNKKIKEFYAEALKEKLKNEKRNNKLHK